MKKFIAMLITIAMCFTLVACSNGNKSQDPKNLKPVESFGNQRNQYNGWESYAKEGNWLYCTLTNDSGLSSIGKFRLDKPTEIQSVYTDDEKSASRLSATGGWIYYVGDAEEDNIPLCRVKENGNDKTILVPNLDSVYMYILTDKEIYYDDKTWLNEPRICVIGLDGSKKQTLHGANGNLEGIDNGWIYFSSYKGSEVTLNRIRPDGAESEKVLDMTDVQSYVVDKEQIYFFRYDEKNDTSYLIRKKINGEETILAGGSFPYNATMNIKDEWLYFNEENAVYKMNVNGGGEKILVYSFAKKEIAEMRVVVNRILLFGDDILISSDTGAVYLRQDGSIIDLGE